MNLSELRSQTTVRLALLLINVVVVPACCCTNLPIGNIQVNTVRFVPTDPNSGSTEPAPSIWIDTHTNLDFSAGTLASSKPYDLSVDFTDNDTNFTAAEFNTVKIVYDDGTVDPAPERQLPRRIDGREYEATNSTGDGRVVKSKLWIISGKIPGVITRDQPFTLEISGRFIKQDGSEVPFTIEQALRHRSRKRHPTCLGSAGGWVRTSLVQVAVAASSKRPTPAVRGVRNRLCQPNLSSVHIVYAL